MAIHLSYQTTEIIAVSRAYKVVVSVQQLCVFFTARERKENPCCSGHQAEGASST